MKYQIPVDGWFSEKVTIQSAEELKDSFGLGKEVVLRKFVGHDIGAAKEAAQNIADTHGIKTCLYRNSASELLVAADATQFSRLSFMYLPAIHIDFTSRAAA